MTFGIFPNKAEIGYGYIKAENQIISIKAPDYIKSLPNRDEIDQLIDKVSQKNIEPYHKWFLCSCFRRGRQHGIIILSQMLFY